MGNIADAAPDDRFQRAMAESAIGMCLVDRDGGFLEVNAALCRFFGFDAAALTGKTWQELTHPDDLEVDSSLVGRVLSGEIEHYRLSKRYLHADGTTLYADLVVSGIRDSEGRFKYFVSQIVDETERTRAEQAYRLLAENASDVVFRGTAESRLEWVSPSVLELLGYRPEEVVGRTMFELVHPDDLPIFQRGRAELAAGRRVYFEVRLAKAQGGHRWTGITARQVYDPAGRLVGRIGNWRDLESERQVREALAASERRLATLAARLPVGLQVFRIRKDGSFGFEYLSPQDARLLGIDADAALRDPEVAFSMLHPDDRAGLVRHVMDLRSNPRPFRWEVRCTVQGEERLLRIESDPEVLENGDSLWHGIVTDVTEQRRAEAAVRELAERDRLLVAESADGIVRVRAGDGVVLDANPAYCAMLGTTFEGLIGRSAFEFFEAEDRSPLRFGALQRGESAHFERRIVTADGRTIVVSARARLLPDGTLLATVRDVTAEREREARKVESQRLEALGRLAGGVAHDFNNLLTAIQGAAELLRESLDAADPRRDDAEAVLDAGHRAAALARQLLAFGRRQPLQPSAVDLREAVTDVTPLLRRSLGPTIDLKLDLAAPLEPVRVDRSQLEQIIANLVLNARDAMPDGGLVTIGAHTAVVDAGTAHQHANVSPGRFVRLSVRDSGQGIEPAIRPHLFEPFFTTKSLGRGSGLGLATIDGIVAQSGGFILVDSEVGRGSTFSVFLPCAERSNDASAVVQAPASERKVASGTVLLVEDEDAVRAVVARSLRGVGYAVLEASGPEQALALDGAALGAVDVLVTDVMMPGMRGDRLAATLLQRYPAMKVLLISGFDPQRTEEGFGAYAVLPKPFKRPELLEAIARLRS